MKILSVAIAAYNVEKYLDKCLTSFADERLCDGLEVLVVNDGSKDRTPEIAADYVRRYPAIFRLINKENGGHGSAVNAGIEQATGKYFRVVDGDDWVNTDDLVRLIDRMRELDTDLVVDQRRTVHMVTGEEVFLPLPQGTPFEQTVEFLDHNGPDICDFYHMHTVSAKLSLLHEHGIRLREHIFYVDYEYVLKTTASSRTVTFLDLDVYRYLIGNSAQSVDSQNYVRRISHHEQVVRELLRYATESGFEGRMKAYVDHRVALILNTHFTIALIYNKDRKQGVAQAKEFRAFLQKEYPAFYRLSARRYRQARILHAFGVDYDRLQVLMGRGGRKAG